MYVSESITCVLFFLLFFFFSTICLHACIHTKYWIYKECTVLYTKKKKRKNEKKRRWKENLAIAPSSRCTLSSFLQHKYIYVSIFNTRRRERRKKGVSRTRILYRSAVKNKTHTKKIEWKEFVSSEIMLHSKTIKAWSQDENK